METSTTSNQPTQQEQQDFWKQQQEQQTFDSQTQAKIKSSLQSIHEKNQRQQTGNFIKFTADGQHKRLSFTGNFRSEKVPAKDFKTGEPIQGKFTEQYFFDCYEITDPNRPSELSTWQRGSRDSETILYWLSNGKNVLDVTRSGQPGSKSTTYKIYPPIS